MILKPNEVETDHFGVDDIPVNPDDNLPPVVKLEKYATSEIMFNRQVVARNLLETLRVAVSDPDEVARVITVLCNISEDYEPSVRSELMEQIPHIAAFCSENALALGNTIQKYIVPMIINYLGDPNNQVRKICHSTLLSLVEQELIDLQNLHERICPLLVHQTEINHPEDQRTETVLLISKLATLLGKEITVKLFLDRFCTLCLDQSFHVRKVCASSLGDFSSTVGRELTEEKLLTKLFCLCEDPIWGVRKACAEVFMPVSCICSMETRRKPLANVFMDLLSDQSRWVRVASYQALGPFISTFAEPDKTGLYCTKDGILTVVDIPYTPLEHSVFSEPCESCSNTTNSENDAFYSSIDRTNLTSDSCDNVVPVCIAESYSTLSSPKDAMNRLVYPSVPSISCHSGNNYCTVIEVSSPTNGLGENDSTASTNFTGTNHVENGYSCDPMCVSGATSNDFDYLKSSSEDDAIDSKKDVWFDIYGLSEDTSHMNGDLATEEEDEEEDEEDQEEEEDNDDVYSENLIENISTSPDTKCNGCECELKLLSTVTVNGINISSSVALNGALHCEILPLGSNSVIVEDKSNIEPCSDNCNVNEISPIELGAQSNENAQSNVERQNSLYSCDTPECDDPQTNSLDSNSEDMAEGVDEEDSSELEVNEPDENELESAFNHFQYWRTPLPEVDLLDLLLNSEQSDSSFISFSSTGNSHLCYGENRHRALKDRRILTHSSVEGLNGELIYFSNLTELSDDDDNIKSVKNYCSFGQNKEGEPPPRRGCKQAFSAHDQDIIPPELLLRYLGMTNVTRAQTVDAEIARYCAYSLPAVALTLGRKFWPCLRETYNTLASDMQGFIMQWKVRRTLASSMHQIAVILGPDITAKDLVPIFSGFIKDLDEVRIGILQHISEFLKVLRIQERRLFLPQLSEFLNSDNDRNWRFRLILAEQLIPIADLYNPEDVRDYLVPLSMALVWDKICEVRLAAVRVMAAMMRRMSQSPTSALTKAVLNELAEKFIHAPKWMHRQLYVYLCQEFILENSLPPDQFAEDAMPHLLYLCWDRVPNVRVAIARCLAAVIWPLETFSDPESPHRELLLQTIHTLQSDTDSDVRYYANMVSTHECSCLQHAELNDLTSESFI